MHLFKKRKKKQNFEQEKLYIKGSIHLLFLFKKSFLKKLISLIIWQLVGETQKQIFWYEKEGKIK